MTCQATVGTSCEFYRQLAVKLLLHHQVAAVSGILVQERFPWYLPRLWSSSLMFLQSLQFYSGDQNVSIFSTGFLHYQAAAFCSSRCALPICWAVEFCWQTISYTARHVLGQFCWDDIIKARYNGDQ